MIGIGMYSVAGAAGVHAPRDIRGLRMDRGDDRTGLCVEAVVRFRVTNVPDDLAYDILYFDIGVGRDLTTHERQSGRHKTLTPNA
jgi:hypothetical protein